MSLSERLMLLVKFEGKQRNLAAKINTTSQSISKTITMDRGLSGSTITAIAEAYPQLNMRWFLTGEGESGLDGEVPVVVPVEEKDPEKEMLKEELLTVYKEKSSMQDEKIKLLENELRMIKREVKEHAPGLAERLEL